MFVYNDGMNEVEAHGGHPPRIAVVSPRLPLDGAIGGAETLLLNLSRLLVGAGCDVTFLTTCSTNRDGKWTNDIPEGESLFDGLKVIRFPADGGRLRGLGDVECPGLIDHLTSSSYDGVLAGPYLFGLVMSAVAAVPGRGFLVPCLHDEDNARESRVKETFKMAGGFCFNTPEERALAIRLYKGAVADKPMCVAGFAMPDFEADPAEGRRLAGTDAPYIIYCGRREPMKGTPLIIDYWAAFRECHKDIDLKLVLTGIGNVDVPEGCAGSLIDLGDVADERKRHDLMAGAVAFCHASVNESLGIVLLESWLARRPVLVHASGEVLREQTKRANGGLWFRDFADFNECLELLLRDKHLSDALGEAGRSFTLDEYSPSAVSSRLMALLGVRGI